MKILSETVYNVNITREDTTIEMSFGPADLTEILIANYCMCRKVPRERIDEDLCAIKLSKNRCEFTIVVRGEEKREEG